MIDEIRQVNPNDIIVGERYRQGYPDADKLAQSIKEDGLAVPLLVDEKLNLIYGGRRLEACKIAQLTSIPVRVKSDMSSVEKKKYELLENLFRKDYTPYEECQAKRDIDEIQKQLHGDQAITHDRTSWSLRKTAEMLNESPSSLSQDIALADAMDHLPELKECKTKDEARKLFKKLIEKAAVNVLKKRAGIRNNRHFQFAEHHYQVGDAIEGLRSIEHQTVASFAEVDPPYGIGLSDKKRVDVDLININKYTEVASGEYPKLITEIAKQLHRVLADNAWIVWWFGIQWYDVTLTCLLRAGFEVDIIPAIWSKINASGQTNRPELYLGRGYETFFIGRKGSPVMRERGARNVFDFQPVTSQKKIHSTEKPIELMNKLIEIFCYPGTIAIIPFLGSGVTLRALYQHDMTGFGFDLSEENKEEFLGAVAKDIEEGLYDNTNPQNEG